MKSTLISIFLVLIILATSCQTYRIPTSSFVNQLSAVDSTSLKPVTVIGPVGEKTQYLSNQLQILRCIDKKGNPVELVVKPSIEIRVHDLEGKKTIFYFDRTMLVDSVLIGARSRFIPGGYLKEIEIKNIRLIEVQDGKKNFRYTN